MKAIDELPPCRPDSEHHFADLGTKDDGTKVSRCGTCMTEKHEKEGTVSYKVPAEPSDRAPEPRFHELSTRAAQKAKASEKK